MSTRRLFGQLQVPGDKSISHRALIFSLLCQGTSEISGLSPAADCRNTASCLQQLGTKIETRQGQYQETERHPAGDTLLVFSPGLELLTESVEVLDAGNSGTTIRLLAGLLAGLPFQSRFDGDASLRMRPMGRVLDPLTQFGARVTYQKESGFAPFAIDGGRLQSINYDCPVASAQVQTALVLAALQAEGESTITVPGPVRDHTERMFQYLQLPFKSTSPGSISVTRLTKPLQPFKMTIPGDVSSAAFFMVAAACLPGSDLVLTNIGLNPGRRLVLDVLIEMGARISITNQTVSCGEPVADLVIKGGGRLQAATIAGDTIAAGIDEIPILALAGALAEGTFRVRGAEELRVKESDRLKLIVSNLQGAGCKVTEMPDGFEVQGQPELTGGFTWQTHGDHRLAMTGLIANLLSKRPITIDNPDCISVSYPSFVDHLHQVTSEQ